MSKPKQKQKWWGGRSEGIEEKKRRCGRKEEEKERKNKTRQKSHCTKDVRIDICLQTARQQREIGL